MPKRKPNKQLMDPYVAEINTYPLLCRAEELALARRYQDQGDLQAARQLVVSNLRFVVKIAHEYAGYSIKLLDLIQEGNIGLMIAVSKFEPSKGYRLISYAVWWIRAYIQNFIMHSWSLVKLGTTQGQRKLFFKLRSARERADQEAGAGVMVSVEELARRLGVMPQEVIDMQMRLGTRDFSLDAERQEGSKQTHLDLLTNSDEEGDVEEQYAVHEKRCLVRGKVHRAMRRFNEKERYIVENRLMADEPQTLQAIGQHFCISRERARQIESNVIRKIRGVLLSSGLEPEPVAA